MSRIGSSNSPTIVGEPHRNPSDSLILAIISLNSFSIALNNLTSMFPAASIPSAIFFAKEAV